MADLLPDIPADLWNNWSADQFAQAAQERIAGFHDDIASSVQQALAPPPPPEPIPVAPPPEPEPAPPPPPPPPPPLEPAPVDVAPPPEPLPSAAPSPDVSAGPDTSAAAAPPPAPAPPSPEPATPTSLPSSASSTPSTSGGGGFDPFLSAINAASSAGADMDKFMGGFNDWLNKTGGDLTLAGLNAMDQAGGSAQQYIDNLHTAFQNAPKPQDLVQQATQTASNAGQAVQSTASAAGLGPIDSSSPSAFAKSFAPYAQYAAQQLGIDPTWVTAMAASESNYGKAAGNELFGIKALPGQKGTTMMTHEGEYGGTNMNQTFASYDTPLDAVNAYIDLLKNHYKGAVGAQDLGTFVHGLRQGGYFTAAEDEYKGILQSISNRVGPDVQNALSSGASTGIQAVNTARDAARGAAARTSQFAMGLSSGDAMAFCGPAAAMAFANTFGRNPTVEEAKQLAQQVGWSTAGMAGPASEVSLLNKLGIATHLTNGVDWDAVGRDASGGNPVILSTPDHYYYVDGYNAQTGQFHLGSSATDIAKNTAKQEWFTPDQIPGLGQGTPTSAIFADHPLSGAGQAIQNAGSNALSTVNNLLDDAGNAVGSTAQKARDTLSAVLDTGISSVQSAVSSGTSKVQGLPTPDADLLTSLPVLPMGVSLNDLSTAAQTARTLGGSAGSAANSVQDLLNNPSTQDTLRDILTQSGVLPFGLSLNDLTSGAQTVRNLGGGASDLLSRAHDELNSPTLQQDLYQNSPTGWFNNQLSSLGPALTGGQTASLDDILNAPLNARMALGQAISGAPTDNALSDLISPPGTQGAADILKSVVGEFLQAPAMIDAPKTLHDLESKYGQGISYDDQGKLQITPIDTSTWSPEDADAYRQAQMAMIGIETPEMPKTGTRILNEAGDLLATNKAPMESIFARATGEGQLQRALDALDAYPDEIANPIRSFIESQSNQPASDVAATVLKFLQENPVGGAAERAAGEVVSPAEEALSALSKPAAATGAATPEYQQIAEKYVAEARARAEARAAPDISGRPEAPTTVEPTPPAPTAPAPAPNAPAAGAGGPPAAGRTPAGGRTPPGGRTPAGGGGAPPTAPPPRGGGTPRPRPVRPPAPPPGGGAPPPAPPSPPRGGGGGAPRPPRPAAVPSPVAGGGNIFQRLGQAVARAASPAQNLNAAARSTIENFANAVGRDSRSVALDAQQTALAHGLTPAGRNLIEQGLVQQETQRMIASLQAQGLAAPARNAPLGYRTASDVPGTLLNRYAFHPDVAGIIKNITEPSQMRGQPLFNFLNNLTGVGKQTIFSLSNFHTLTEGINAAVSGPQTLRNYARGFLSANWTQSMRNGAMARDFLEAARDGVTGMNAGSGSSADSSARFARTISNRLAASGVAGLGGGAAGYVEGKREGLSNEDALVEALKYGTAGAALAGLPLGRRGTVSEILSTGLWDRAVPMAKATAYRGLVNGGMTGREAASVVNQRFGGLNYAAMGRDPTLQDAMRLSIMAPDWNESTVRQLGQVLFGGSGAGVQRAHVAKALAGTIAVTELLNYFSTGHSTLDNDPGHQLEVQHELPNGENMHVGLLPGNYQSYLGELNKVTSEDSAKRGADLRNFATGRLSAPLQFLGELAQSTETNSLRQPFGYSKAGPIALGETVSPIGIEQVAQGVHEGGIDPVIAIAMAALGLNPRYSTATGGGGAGGGDAGRPPLPSPRSSGSSSDAGRPPAPASRGSSSSSSDSGRPPLPTRR